VENPNAGTIYATSGKVVKIPPRRLRNILLLLGIKLTWILPQDIDVLILPQFQNFRIRKSRDSQIVVTRVHDLFPIYYPEDYGFFQRMLFAKRLKSGEASDIFLANSKDTKQSLVLYGFDPLKVEVLECNNSDFIEKSIPSCTCQQLSQLKLAFGSKNFLTVGAFTKRKNHLRLFEDWSKVDSSSILIVIGELTEKRYFKRLKRAVQKLGLLNRIFLFPGICDFCLKFSYQNVDGYISSSHAEGFDIPLSDALRLGIQSFAYRPNVIHEMRNHKYLAKSKNLVHFVDNIFPKPENSKLSMISGSDFRTRLLETLT